eukprot:1159790-Pelagomonas_calceolata.AAC.5
MREDCAGSKSEYYIDEGNKMPVQAERKEMSEGCIGSRATCYIHGGNKMPVQAERKGAMTTA